MTTRLPEGAPVAVIRTATALVAQGYVLDRLYRFPGHQEPLLRMFLTGPRWLLLLAGLAWLTAYGLARVPLTRSAGVALLRSRFTLAPVIYIDASGVAHTH